MKPEEYVNKVEEIAKKKSLTCGYPNLWREELQDINTSFGSKRAPDRCECWKEQNKCDKCIICKRCGWRYDPNQKMSIHGTAGDYENLPEVYLASSLIEPWYNKNIIQFKPIYNALIKDNYKAMLMTEKEIYDGLKSIQKKYPRIVAWVHYETLYFALLARMISVIKILTEWMEKRSSWYTPSGEFYWLSREYPKIEKYFYDIRLNLPPLAQEGLYNLPTYFSRTDWSATTMDTNHSIKEWIETNNLSLKTLYLLGRALASNPQQWKEICCASMNGYNVIKDFVGCICHAIKSDDIKIDIYSENSMIYNTSLNIDKYKKIIWHTNRSRCSYCILDSHSKHNEYFCNCLPSTIIEPLPIKPYEIVMAHAVNTRRRKFRGLLFCITKLIGKIRMLHYKPIIGMYYKEAEIDFYSHYLTKPL